MKRRRSLQREKIYQIIQNIDTHPTAKSIIEIIKKDFPNTGKGNVYRNIQILLEEGRIKKTDFGDGIDHYDAITSPHYHFVCEICNSISDFDLSVDNNINEKAQTKTSNRITGHTIQFFGVCEKCNKKKS